MLRNDALSTLSAPNAAILNEVLSLNAQEYVHGCGDDDGQRSSMKS